MAAATPAAADPDEEPAEVVDDESLERRGLDAPVPPGDRPRARSSAPRRRSSSRSRSSSASASASEPWTAILDIHEWTPQRHRGQDPGQEPGVPCCRSPRRPTASSWRRFADDGALDLLTTAPKVGLTDAIASADRRGRASSSARPATSGRSTTSGSTLRRSARSSTGSTATAAGRSSVTSSRSWRCAPGPATRSRSRRFAAGSRAGNDVETVAEMIDDLTTKGRAARDHLTSANLRLVVANRQEVHEPRPRLPGPHPGGQRRPDARRRQVRVAARLQVLDVRDVVDPPGDPRAASPTSRGRSASRSTWSRPCSGSPGRRAS